MSAIAEHDDLFRSQITCLELIQSPVCSYWSVACRRSFKWIQLTRAWIFKSSLFPRTHSTVSSSNCFQTGRFISEMPVLFLNIYSFAGIICKALFQFVIIDRPTERASLNVPGMATVHKTCRENWFLAAKGNHLLASRLHKLRRSSRSSGYQMDVLDDNKRSPKNDNFPNH